MKLSNYIIDLGRAVAYYPGLKKITGSTTATILLCQFLYWTPKAKEHNGVIYKTQYEIEEETGLTYNEQKTAKETLKKLNLLEYNFDRLDHTSGYKVNLEEFNSQWEETTGSKSKSILQETFSPDELETPEEYFAKLDAEKKKKPKPEKPVIAKKGDPVDGVLFFENARGMKKMKIMTEIRELMRSKLNINVEGRYWESFIEFLYVRQESYNEPASKFIKWALKNGFNPVYWTPEKMRTLHPSAFIKDTSNEIDEEFVKSIPVVVEKEKEYAPMPEGLRKRKKLY